MQASPLPSCSSQSALGLFCRLSPRGPPPLTTPQCSPHPRELTRVPGCLLSHTRCVHRVPSLSRQPHSHPRCCALPVRLLSQEALHTSWFLFTAHVWLIHHWILWVPPSQHFQSWTASPRLHGGWSEPCHTSPVLTASMLTARVFTLSQGTLSQMRPFLSSAGTVYVSPLPLHPHSLLFSPLQPHPVPGSS